MDIVKTIDGFVIKSGESSWLEGLYESKKLAENATSMLDDINLSQLYMTVLSAGRKVITNDDYEQYLSVYNIVSSQREKEND